MEEPSLIMLQHLDDGLWHWTVDYASGRFDRSGAEDSLDEAMACIQAAIAIGRKG